VNLSLTQPELSQSQPSRSRSRSRSPPLDDGQKSHSRSPSRSRRHHHSRSRSRSPSQRNSETTLLQKISEISQRLRAVEQLKSRQSLDNSESEFFILSERHPEIKVSREKLKDKIAAKTPSAKIKGVYDLLVPRAQQAKYSGKGKGKFPVAPLPIREALTDFFQKRLNYDPSPLITEAINEKGAQARSDIKQAAQKKATTTEETR